MPARQASAVWEGTLREGHGTMKMVSGSYEGPYSWSSRFEEGTGTNPEELIAAAHAGCFSMALSAQLTGANFPPRSVSTTARVNLTKLESGGFGITRIDLITEANVPGIDEAPFQDTAQAAKAGCPVSQALKAVEITLDAKLVS